MHLVNPVLVLLCILYFVFTFQDVLSQGSMSLMRVCLFFFTINMSLFPGTKEGQQKKQNKQKHYYQYWLSTKLTF